MGLKHRFRLSDMIPNAWFYKLKDMSKSIPTTTTTTTHKKKKRPPPSTLSAAAARAPQQQQPRYSYFAAKSRGAANNHHHYHHHKLYNSPVNQKASDTQFPDPPRRSSRRRKTVYKPSPKLLSPSSSSVCSRCRDHSATKPPTLLHSPDYSTSPFESSSPDFCGSILTRSDDEDDDDFASSFVIPPPRPRSSDDQVVSASWSTSCHSCKVSSSSTADIIIDVNGHSFGRNAIHELEKLPPIVTKPSKTDHVKPQRSASDQKRRTKSSPKSSPSPRKSTSNNKHSATTGIRLKANSPRRLASRKLQGGGSRKSTGTTCLSAAGGGNRIGESFAVVKSSVDPERDFMESMVEMIVENGIRSSKELEDLLACYLSLNSTKYHDVIVRAFEQIWFHMS